MHAQLASNYCVMRVVLNIAPTIQLLRHSPQTFSAMGSFQSPKTLSWHCPLSPALVQVSSICRVLHNCPGRKKRHPQTCHLQQHPYLSPESSSMKRFPAVPVLNIQACPLVKKDFSCMQITIGCSYMQLGDKEQSMNHLQGPRMVLYTKFQLNFLDNLWV